MLAQQWRAGSWAGAGALPHPQGRHLPSQPKRAPSLPDPPHSARCNTLLRGLPCPHTFNPSLPAPPKVLSTIHCCTDCPATSRFIPPSMLAPPCKALTVIHCCADCPVRTRFVAGAASASGPSNVARPRFCPTLSSPRSTLQERRVKERQGKTQLSKVAQRGGVRRIESASERVIYNQQED